MKELQIWNFILTELKKKNKIILYCVAGHEKGSPGKTGFKMAVSSSGDFTGSIGGGIMEYGIIKKCIKNFPDVNSYSKAERYFHHKGKLPDELEIPSANSGLICAGSQLLLSVSITAADLPEIKKLTESFNIRKPLKIIISSKGFRTSAHGRRNSGRYLFQFKSINSWKFTEDLSFAETVLIAGAGHVGTSLSRLMYDLGFNVVLYDDRKDLIIKNNMPDGINVIIDSYSKIRKQIIDPLKTYAVIVTTGFESDREVLFQLADKNLKYLGLMGTGAKIRKIFSEAAKQGVRRDLLRKVKAPAGIEIQSSTPEEISVSIAAEIIRLRNSKI
ncbi:MAG: XdhC family protein [Bacteroidetes bacterium]|nr:XdhC family protein [Bacteroidota bacterium]